MDPDPLIVDFAGEHFSLSLKDASVAETTTLDFHAEWTGGGTTYFQFRLPDYGYDLITAGITSASPEIILEIGDFFATFAKPQAYVTVDLDCGDFTCNAHGTFSVDEASTTLLVLVALGGAVLERRRAREMPRAQSCP